MKSAHTPHGAGFSFVDTFEILLPDRKIRAQKWLDPAMTFFADHFPEQPLMPGVLLIESGAQAAGVLWGGMNNETVSKSGHPLFILAQVVAFKIQRPVEPGQTIEIQATWEREFGLLAQFAVEILEKGEVVATGRIILSRSQA